MNAFGTSAGCALAQGLEALGCNALRHLTPPGSPRQIGPRLCSPRMEHTTGHSWSACAQSSRSEILLHTMHAMDHNIGEHEYTRNPRRTRCTLVGPRARSWWDRERGDAPRLGADDVHVHAGAARLVQDVPGHGRPARGVLAWISRCEGTLGRSRGS